jgi:hypothetical protein
VGQLWAVGSIGGDLNRRGSPGGSPYHGFVNHHYNLLNISHIGRARLLPSRGGPNYAQSAEAEQIGRPQDRPQDGPNHA